jgi:hypothetical protein
MMIMEQISEASQGEEDEILGEWLEIFGQGDEKEMTVALKLAAREEEEADDMDFYDLCEEFESPERRVMVQILDIQEVKLEIGEKY